VRPFEATALRFRLQIGTHVAFRPAIPGRIIPTVVVSWRLMHCRFQVVVLSAYKQIRSQSDDILSDIDEDNYDRAFSFLRPGMLRHYLYVSRF